MKKYRTKDRHFSYPIKEKRAQKAILQHLLLIELLLLGRDLVEYGASG